MDREEIIKFMRFYAADSQTEKEPLPNSIEDILHQVHAQQGKSQLSREEFINAVADFFSY